MIIFFRPRAAWLLTQLGELETAAKVGARVEVYSIKPWKFACVILCERYAKQDKESQSNLRRHLGVENA